MKVLIAANEIPSGATVTKRAGSKEYTLRREIPFYDPEGNMQVKPRHGCVFLVGDPGVVNVYPGTTEFIWHATEEALYTYLSERLNRDDWEGK